VCGTHIRGGVFAYYTSIQGDENGRLRLLLPRVPTLQREGAGIFLGANHPPLVGDLDAKKYPTGEEDSSTTPSKSRGRSPPLLSSLPPLNPRARGGRWPVGKAAKTGEECEVDPDLFDEILNSPKGPTPGVFGQGGGGSWRG